MIARCMDDIAGVRRLRLLVLFVCLLHGCGGSDGDGTGSNSGNGNPSGSSAESTGTDDGRPTAPLSLPAPPPAPQQFGEFDLSQEPADKMFASAGKYARQGNYEDAVPLQYWAVINSGRTKGLYNLACYESRMNAIDASLYWLQQAAEKEGVDSEWVQIDSDLANTREDARWPAVLAYLKDYNRYWERSGHTVTTLIVPAGYDGKSPLPVVIGLHGMGSSPQFYQSELFQTFADELNIAVVGVSGTLAQGPSTFVWSEELDRDARRIDAALAEVNDRLTVADGQRILLGFSQGGVVSAEVAARDPQNYRGAIIMSPGGNAPGQRIRELSPQPGHKLQHYLCTVGAGESAGNVQLTRDYASALRDLGAKTGFRAVREQKQHSLPPDFETQFPQWVQMILGRGESPAAAP